MAWLASAARVTSGPLYLQLRAGQVDKWSKLKFDKLPQGASPPVSARQQVVRGGETAKTAIEAILEILLILAVAQ